MAVFGILNYIISAFNVNNVEIKFNVNNVRIKVYKRLLKKICK